MPLKEIAITKLSRTDYSAAVSIKLCQDALDVEGPAYSLFEQAKQNLNKSAQKRFGFFDPEAENKQLLGLINNWQDEKFDFVSFANKTSSFMQQQFETADTPFDYVLILAHETILEQHYLYLLALPMKEMMQTNDVLEPLYTQVIDSAKLSFALRLHIEQYDDASPKYLTQVASKGAKDLSDAFIAFSNFKEGIDSKAETEEFVRLVEEYASDLDDEPQKDIKNQIMDYCVAQDQLGLPVLLDELSEQLDEESPDKFSEFVTAKQQKPNREVHTDRSTLKRYMRYFGRDNSLSINFSSERLGTDIFYQPAAGSLRIENIPKSLKKQLASFTDKLDMTPSE